ncbi:MAG: hypothetical protein ACRD0P_18350, partial [Stackebrandtia sp.]
VLVVVRNTASVFRMREIRKLFYDDDRVTIRTTVADNSRYRFGADEQLASDRIRSLSWERAKQIPFDLILSSSADACLHELNGPVIVFPHGAGHLKRPPDADSGNEASDLLNRQLLHNGVPIADWHLLPGQDSWDRMILGCPAIEKRSSIAGDPVAQQLRDHADLRDDYRAALGLLPEQKLVVVASTWGPGSISGQSLDLPRRLVAELPADEYRVAAIFHHNVVMHDGFEDLQRRLHSAVESGLILMPPEDSWQATVIAADCVLGDHGSMLFYSADMAPVAVAAYDPTAYPQDGPAAAMVDAVSHLNFGMPLRPQVDRLLAAPRLEAVRTIVDSTIDHKKDAAAEFRTKMYETMGLPEPAGDAFLHLDMPKPVPARLTAVRAHSTIADDVEPTVTLARYPAAVTSSDTGEFLAVHTDDPDPRRRHSARVLIAAAGWTDLGELLHHWPLCRIAVRALGAGEFLIRLSDGVEFVAITDSAAGADEAAIIASGCYGFVHAKRPQPSRFVVKCGDRTIAVELRTPASHCPR